MNIGFTFFLFSSFLNISGSKTVSIKPDKSEDLIAYTILSENDSGDYLNTVRIDYLENTLNPNDDSTDTVNSIDLVPVPKRDGPDEVKARAVITDPTGFDKQEIAIYMITGITMLIIAYGAIVIIKKKVL